MRRKKRFTHRKKGRTSNSGVSLVEFRELSSLFGAKGRLEKEVNKRVEERKDLQKTHVR